MSVNILSFYILWFAMPRNGLNCKFMNIFISL